MSASDALPNRPRRRISASISRRPDLSALLLASAALALPGQAGAQALSCTVPAAIPTPEAAGPSAAQPVRRIPVASYTLALTWS
ncbi:MAG: hypothetical protein QM690_20655, partial [Sphingobium sp.]